MPLKPLVSMVMFVGVSLPVAAAPVAPIDTNNRSAVVQFFRDVYLPTSGLAAGWTGSVASCSPGATSAAYKDATITRVNYYRAMAGLPGTVVLDGALDSASQSAALMMSANAAINHNPPTTWTCYTSQGASAAAQSFIALFSAGPEAIARYVDDAGPLTGGVDHRRGILFPPQQTMATGSVLEAGVTSSNVLEVIGGSGSGRPATPEFVSWPPPGFVPYQILPAASQRWSISILDADFSMASIAMTKAGVAVATSTLPIVPLTYGDNTLVWQVAGISYGRPASDESYNVTVSNVRIGTSTKTFTYMVTVIDPVSPPPSPPSNLRIIQ